MSAPAKIPAYPRRRISRKPRRLTTSPAAARLSWPVHRDVARIFASWSERFRVLGSEAFAFLLVLEALRVTSPKPERLHYGELAQALGVSTNTLRRWLRILKTAGLVTTTFVPGTHNAQAYFQIHLEQAPPRRPAPRGPRRRLERAKKKRPPR